VYVYETGKVVLDGRASDLLDDEKMRAAYLGSTAKSAPGMSSVESAFAASTPPPGDEARPRS